MSNQLENAMYEYINVAKDLELDIEPKLKGLVIDNLDLFNHPE